MQDDYWDDDLLGRQVFGEHLIKLMKSRYFARKEANIGSLIINLDAPWGSGKTYILDKLSTILTGEGYAVASINAWEEERSSDPLILIMSAITQTLEDKASDGSKAKRLLDGAKSALAPVAVEASKQVGKHLIRTVTGLSIDKLSEVYDDHYGQIDNAELADDTADAFKDLIENKIKAHKIEKHSISSFKRRSSKALNELSKSQLQLPLFVFIDELDRCHPNYAIQLLEDLKHIFDIDGIVFLISTDTLQLNEVVKGYFGNNFDSGIYLRKFFDRTVVLPPASNLNFALSKFELYGVDLSRLRPPEGISLEYIVESWTNFIRCSRRDIEQIAEILSNFTNSWPYENIIDPVSSLLLTSAYFFHPHEFVNSGPGVFFKGATGKWMITGDYSKTSEDAWTIFNHVRSDGKKSFHSVDFDKGYAGRFLFNEMQSLRHSNPMPQGERSRSSEYSDFIVLSAKSVSFRDQ